MVPTATHIDSLVQQCRLGNQRAQLQLYNRYYKAMYNTAFRIVKHTTEAEDIMQEAFLKAFRKLDSFQGESTFGAWLKRIVINQSIQVWNKNEKYKKIPFEEAFKHAESQDDEFEITPTETHSKARLVLKTMGLLKENYRLVLTLNLIEGYDAEEISEIMNISHGNCRTTLSRAKERLRKKMMSYEK